jgi:hypothetical protein
MQLFKNGATDKTLPWLMVLASDGRTPATGLTPTVTISKNGGSFVAPAGTVAEIGSGWYKLTPSGADTTTSGPLLLHATAATADPADVQAEVLAVDLFDAVALGLTNLDAATSSRASAAAAASLQADTDDLQARLPPALTGAGNIKADALALNGNATAAAVLAILNGATVVYQGTVTGAATTTTLIDSGLTQADIDWWKGRIIIFTSVLTLQATDITAFDPVTDKFTFTAVTAAPTGATYIVI